MMENRRGSTEWGKRWEYNMFCEAKQIKPAEKKMKVTGRNKNLPSRGKEDAWEDRRETVNKERSGEKSRRGWGKAVQSFGTSSLH